MLKAVGCYVVYLKRIAIGNLCLDDTLCQGKYRELTESDKSKIFTKKFFLIFPQEQENQMLKHLFVSFVLPHPIRYRKYRYVRRPKEQVRQQKLQ